jgi:hypothetical protein
MIALKLSEIDVVALTVNPTVQVNNGIKEINCHPMPRKIKSNLKDVEDGFHLYKILYETDLDSTYSSDEEFKKAAILHLYNTVYKQMFLDIENEESDLTRYIDQTNNGIFLEIVDLIKNLDTDHQLKLRDLIKLFLNSIK